MVELARKEGDPDEAALYILAYGFMLRCPSEVLSLIFQNTAPTERRQCASDVHVCQFSGKLARVHLVRRKNARRGDTVDRQCWCDNCKTTCPVHLCYS